MHAILAAASHGSTGASWEGWLLVPIVLVVLWFFGWRPRRAKSMKNAAAGATVRAVGRGARRVGQHSKTPAPQPEDAS